MLDVLTTMYSAGRVNISQLSNTLTFADFSSSAADPVPRQSAAMFSAASQTLQQLIKESLMTFFSVSAKTFRDSSSDDLHALADVMATLQAHTPSSPSTSTVDSASLVEDLLRTSLTGRFHGMSALSARRASQNKEEAARTLSTSRTYSNQSSSSEQELPSLAGDSSPPSATAVLLALVSLVEEELDSLSSSFDLPLLRRVHVPTLAANIFSEGLVPQIDGFARTYASLTPDLEEVLELYRRVRSLSQKYRESKFGVLESSRIGDWFRPFVADWLDLAEQRALEWVQNAANLDTYELLPNLSHSSSVLDIFTSFQQQLDFLLRIDWPHSDEFRSFFVRYLEGVTTAIEKFCLLMRDGFMAELQKPTVMTKTAGKTTRKFRIKLRRYGPPIDESELRLPARALVRLSNVDAMFSRFEELLKRVPDGIAGRTQDDLPLPPLPPADGRNTSPKPSPTPLRTPLLLTILCATGLTVVRPFSTLVSVRLSSPACPLKPDLELGRTAEVHQPHLAFARRESVPAAVTAATAVLPYAADDPCAIPILLSQQEARAGLRISLVHRMLPVVPGDTAAPVAGSPPGASLTGGGEFVIDSVQFPADSSLLAAAAGGPIAVRIAG
ncbi:hypothetical protein HK405_007356, partial [Cladochytrium tenue]